MEQKYSKWIVLVGLSFVWGSSFILMKFALVGLDPIQVGALRMIISAVFLLLFAWYKVKLIQKRHWKYLFYIALVGTFFPVFLFSFAVLHIDGGIVAILNSLTPLNTLWLGFLFFGFSFSRKQLLGIIIGIMGTVFLISKSAALNPNDNYWFGGLVVLATFGYALNVNILKKHLSDLDSVAISVGNYIVILIPAIIVLFFTGFFEKDFTLEPVLSSLGYISILAVFGTALASVFFAQLVKVSNPIFASSVTYLIPVVAIIWGTFFGEKIYFSQVLAGLVILLAVFLANRKR